MVEIGRRNEPRILNGDRIETVRVYIDGELLASDIASLKAELGEVLDHSIALYRLPIDPEAAVQAEIERVKSTVTALLSGEKSDKLVELIDYMLDWSEGAYTIGDVRKYEGQPKICCQAHDSTGNPTWTPAVASLWSPYHARSAEYALPWIQPTGAQDMYKAGEYMVWTDGKVYKCLSDTVYTPVEYAQAWEAV